jgi:hypothetical protein
MSAKEKVEKGIAEIKADMANFDPDAILRGAQLTLVGAHRALQNPKLFTGEHYRQAALAVAAGIAIRILISIPVSSCHTWILHCLIMLTRRTFRALLFEV